MGSVLVVVGGGNPYAGTVCRFGTVTGVVGTCTGVFGTVDADGAGFGSVDAATVGGTGATGVGTGRTRGSTVFGASGTTWAGDSVFGGSVEHPAKAIEAAAVNATRPLDVAPAFRAQKGHADSET